MKSDNGFLDKTRKTDFLTRHNPRCYFYKKKRTFVNQTLSKILVPIFEVSLIRDDEKIKKCKTTIILYYTECSLCDMYICVQVCIT